MPRLYILASAANAATLALILLGALAAQLIEGEPPCPLCMMQRIAMLLAAIGPCLVLRHAARAPLEPRPIAIGAGMSILASSVGAAIATRQILLHILPNDPGFGAPILGYHLYTWALIVFAANILAAALQLIGLAWFTPAPAPRIAPKLANATTLLIAALLAANILSVIAEAGFAWHLPDNPTQYLLFHPS